MKYLIFTLLFLFPKLACALTFNALESTQTVTAAKTYTSSFTVQSNGRNIILSTSPTSGVFGLIISTGNLIGISTTSQTELFMVGVGTRVFAVSPTGGRVAIGRPDVGSTNELQLHDSVNTTITLTNAAAPTNGLEIAMNSLTANIVNTASNGTMTLGANNQTAITINSNRGIGVSSDTTNSGAAFAVGPSTLTVSSGNVGVGTSSPSSRLDIDGGSVTIKGTNAALSVVGGSMTFTSNGARVIYNESNACGKMVFHTSNALRGFILISSNSSTTSGMTTFTISAASASTNAKALYLASACRTVQDGVAETANNSLSFRFTSGGTGQFRACQSDANLASEADEDDSTVWVPLSSLQFDYKCDGAGTVTTNLCQATLLGYCE